jgi:hypothetical protein
MSSVLERADQIKPAWRERFQVPLYLTIVGGLAATAVYAPGLIRFWPFSAAEFVQRMVPLFLISLFIDRALDVFVPTGRGPKVLNKEHPRQKISRRLAKIGNGARAKCSVWRSQEALLWG